MDESDRVNAKNYELKAFSDIYWIRTAKDLTESASLLKPKITEVWDSYRGHSKDRKTPLKADHYQRVYFMLLGFAVENLFKAAIVREKSSSLKKQFEKKKRLPNVLKGHKLVALAKKAKFGITLEEEDLLRRLTKSVIWYGRYPVPLYYKEMSGNEEFSNGEDYSVSYFGGDDLERLDSLLCKIRKHWDFGNA